MERKQCKIYPLESPSIGWNNKVTMIYAQPPFPISIQKVNLKIWRLRDELEWIIQNRLVQAQGDPQQIDLTDLKKLYRQHLPELSQIQPARVKKFQLSPSAKISEQILKRSRPDLRREQLYEGVVALMDLSMDTIACFCNQSFLVGQTVVVEFLIPQHFFITGEIVRCHSYDKKNNVISLQKSTIRLHLRWIYLLPGERTMLRRFLQSISPKEAKTS